MPNRFIWRRLESKQWLLDRTRGGYNQGHREGTTDKASVAPSVDGENLGDSQGKCDWETYFRRKVQCVNRLDSQTCIYMYMACKSWAYGSCYLGDGGGSILLDCGIFSCYRSASLNRCRTPDPWNIRTIISSRSVRQSYQVQGSSTLWLALLVTKSQSTAS